MVVEAVISSRTTLQAHPSLEADVIKGRGKETGARHTRDIRCLPRGLWSLEGVFVGDEDLLLSQSFVSKFLAFNF